MERCLFPSTWVSSHFIYVTIAFLIRYCSGGELFNYIIQRKHLSESEAAMIMKQLLSALVYVHSMKISHRDIKPENFMLANPDDPTCVKMIDFGLSKDFSGQESMKTMSGSVSPHLKTNLILTFTALLHRPRSILAKLRFQNWHLVPRCSPIHYAFWKSTFPR